MTRLALLALALLLPVSSGAATILDRSAGTIHFTDDIGAVPPKYRTKALRQVAGEETGSDTRPAAATPASRPDAAPAAKAGPPAADANGGATATSATRFGDRSAAAWQTEFRQMRAELKRIEQDRELLKQQIGEGKRMLSNQQVTDYNIRTKQLNQEYEATRLRFNQLVEQANKAGLPPEFSQ
jgi:hypothetical protein